MLLEVEVEVDELVEEDVEVVEVEEDVEVVEEEVDVEDEVEVVEVEEEVEVVEVEEDVEVVEVEVLVVEVEVVVVEELVLVVEVEVVVQNTEAPKDQKVDGLFWLFHSVAIYPVGGSWFKKTTCSIEPPKLFPPGNALPNANTPLKTVLVVMSPDPLWAPSIHHLYLFVGS